MFSDVVLVLCQAPNVQLEPPHSQVLELHLKKVPWIKILNCCYDKKSTSILQNFSNFVAVQVNDVMHNP